MSEFLTELMVRPDDGGISICLSCDSKGLISQNSVCRTVCGPKSVISECEDSCFKVLESTDCSKVGDSYYFPIARKKDLFFKLFVIVRPNQRMLVFHPISGSTGKLIDKLKDLRLTDRELTIVGYLRAGYSRESLAVLLDIKKATLKTHIKNIYNKIPKALRKELETYESG